MSLSSRHLTLAYAFTFTLLFASAGAHATKDEEEKKGPGCNNVLQFHSKGTRPNSPSLLPIALQKVAENPALQHLVTLAQTAPIKESGGQRVSILELGNLDCAKICSATYETPKEVLRLPHDLLSAEELEILRPQIQVYGFQKIFEQSFEIPKFKIIPIPKIKLSSGINILGATPDGYPVLLEYLPVQGRGKPVQDRASTAFVIAGLKIMSDHKVLPNLLGVTEMEDGSLMAVYPIPAGFEQTNVTAIKIGMKVRHGLRASQPFELENARISPFEALVDRLVGSDWPLTKLSVDLAWITGEKPEAKIDRLVDHMLMPLWESYTEEFRDPFFFPRYLAFGDSPWFPAIFSERYRLTVSIPGESVTQPIHAPLLPIDAIAQFGRVTLLRYEFFMNIMNGKAKVSYLDYLESKSPEGQQNLVQLIEFFAHYNKNDKLTRFISNYKAKKYREAFQVIDGPSN